MSPADSATAEDPVIDDDLVQALGFEPANEIVLDDDFGPNKMYADVLDVTGNDPVLTSSPEMESAGPDTNDHNSNGDSEATNGLIVLDSPPPPTLVPSGPPLLTPLPQSDTGLPQGYVPQPQPDGQTPIPRRLAPNVTDDHDYRVESVGRGRAKLRARKVRRVVRHIDPWSVLTFSVIFFLFIFGALLLAAVLIFNAAEAAGTVEKVESLIRELADLETFEIDEQAIFRAAIVIAGMLTLAASVMVVLLTVVFNLISDLVGGIRMTVIEEERVRVVRRQSRRETSAAARQVRRSEAATASSVSASSVPDAALADSPPPPPGPGDEANIQ